MKKVKVTWRNKNPFTPRIENLGQVSEAELPDETTFGEIEQFAKEATPTGYFLHKIETPTETRCWDVLGRQIEPKKQ